PSPSEPVRWRSTLRAREPSSPGCPWPADPRPPAPNRSGRPGAEQVSGVERHVNGDGGPDPGRADGDEGGAAGVGHHTTDGGQVVALALIEPAPVAPLDRADGGDAARAGGDDVDLGGAVARPPAGHVAHGPQRSTEAGGEANEPVPHHRFDGQAAPRFPPGGEGADRQVAPTPGDVGQLTFDETEPEPQVRI